jgi:hypothetical protein
MAKKTPAKLRADAANIRKNAAQALVHADRLEREAEHLEEQEAAKQEANRLLAESYFAWRRRLAAAH